MSLERTRWGFPGGEHPGPDAASGVEPVSSFSGILSLVLEERLAALTVSRLVVGAEDRAAFFPTSNGAVLVVADGAGGMGGGAATAEALVAAVGSSLDVQSAQGWATLLEMFDAGQHLGETTAVVCSIIDDQIVGASVGDSGAWRIDHREPVSIVDLTHAQRRKPLLGSGRAVVVPFAARLGDTTLLLASDGLLKYAPADRIAACLRGTDLDMAAGELLGLVRLRSGALPDDFSVLLARRR